MLTTGREIKNKEDKYGNFERRDNTALKEKYSMNDIRTVEDSLGEKQKTKQSQVNLGKKQRLTVSDTYKNKINDKDMIAGVPSKQKMSTKNILMICAYAMVVIALVTVIALNSSALTSLTEKNAVLASDVNALNTQYSALETELTDLKDPTRLSNLATETLNLTEKSSNVKVMKLATPKVAPVAEYTQKTNWFDKLCEVFSGSIG